MRRVAWHDHSTMKGTAWSSSLAFVVPEREHYCLPQSLVSMPQWQFGSSPGLVVHIDRPMRKCLACESGSVDVNER